MKTKLIKKILPFSILFGGFIVVVFALGIAINMARQSDKTNASLTTDQSAAALAQVKGLYDTWDAPYDQSTTSTDEKLAAARKARLAAFLTPEYTQQIMSQQLAYDPVFCAQNTPRSIRYDQPTLSGKDALTVVTRHAYDDGDKIVTFKLRRSDNRIDNIICTSLNQTRGTP